MGKITEKEGKGRENGRGDNGEKEGKEALSISLSLSLLYTEDSHYHSIYLKQLRKRINRWDIFDLEKNGKKI